MSEQCSKKAVILLSGGIDSAVSLAIAKKDGFECYCLSFDYGQRHRWELECASKIAKAIGAKEHLIFALNLRAIGGSALTDDIEVPTDRDLVEIASQIPVTYVPARNTIFLSIALAYAEVKKAYDIFIGVNAIDYSGYPDCRQQYIEAFEKMANLATKEAVQGRHFKIHTPLISLKKSEIISLGHSLGVDFSLTNSCYQPSKEGIACGSCDSCLLRKQGFKDALIEDVTRYANKVKTV